MGQEFLNLKDPEEVKDIISSLKIDVFTEIISTCHAHQRVLAETIESPLDLPQFNRVSMDGYAIKSEDSFSATEDSPIKLKLMGSLRAGDYSEEIVQKGYCMEVATGAPLPQGADAVVMVEYTEKNSNDILIFEGIAPGSNIAKKGSDLKKGQILLEKNTLLSPDKLGVLAAVGLEEIKVIKPPLIDIISTGNEIIPLGTELKPAKIYDINSLTISSSTKSCGCATNPSVIVKDDYKSLKNSIIESKADIIITSGGTSAGAGDVLREVVEDLGEVLVHGISVKPGKPTLIGKFNNKLLIGLPGYPVAALIVFKVFFEPFLRKLAGYSSKPNKIVNLPTSRRIRPTKGRVHYMLIKIDNGFIKPILKDSGAIKALAEADGYIIISKNTEIIEKGTNVDVNLFE